MIAPAQIIIGMTARITSIRSRDIGMIGSGALVSHQKNEAPSTTAAVTRAMVIGVNQPFDSPDQLTPRISDVTDVTRRRAPVMSTFASFFRNGSRRLKLTTVNAMMPIGKLMKKIQRHEVLSTMNPPMRGPTTLAMVNTLVITPTYRPRSRGGTMSPTIVKAMAKSPPPPMPWMPRATTSCHMFCATPHSSDDATNETIAIWKSKRRPKRSDNLPKRGVATVEVSR